MRITLDRLESQKADLLNKKSRIESGRPLTPEKLSKNKKGGFLRSN